MGNLVNKVVEIGTFGLVDDITGTEKAEQAAVQAGELQATAAEQGIDEQRRQFDITQQNLQEAQQFAREQQQPFQQTGTDALNQQRILLGLGASPQVSGTGISSLKDNRGPQFSPLEQQQQAFAAFSESPGQRFLRDRQEKALLRNAASIGGLRGGNVRTAQQQ